MPTSIQENPLSRTLYSYGVPSMPGKCDIALLDLFHIPPVYPHNILPYIPTSPNIPYKRFHCLAHYCLHWFIVWSIFTVFAAPFIMSSNVLSWRPLEYHRSDVLYLFASNTPNLLHHPFEPEVFQNLRIALIDT